MYMKDIYKFWRECDICMLYLSYSFFFSVFCSINIYIYIYIFFHTSKFFNVKADDRESTCERKNIIRIYERELNK